VRVVTAYSECKALNNMNVGENNESVVESIQERATSAYIQVKVICAHDITPCCRPTIRTNDNSSFELYGHDGCLVVSKIYEIASTASVLIAIPDGA